MRSSQTSFISPVLIGRAAVQQRLSQLIDAAREDRGQLVLISGEAGIGKSRLVTEAATRFAASGDGLVLKGRCFEPDRTLPFAPLLDLLRQHLGNHTSDALVRELGPAAPDFITLLPELRQRLPETAPQALLEPDAEKRRLFDTLFQWFARLCGDGGLLPVRPLLVVLEDLHARTDRHRR